MNVRYMGVLNLNSDSFYAPSRVSISQFMLRVQEFLSRGAAILDLGAVSTRPGASEVSFEEEWGRLEPALMVLSQLEKPLGAEISIDTTSAQVVRRTYNLIGNFIVNDISAGCDDPEMLRVVGELGLKYVAMHKRGNPRTMDSLCEYPDGVVQYLVEYFKSFSTKALAFGIKDWIIDPGLGFSKTKEQNWEILYNLDKFAVFSRPILIGAADKRFTEGNTDLAHKVAIESLSKLASPPELILRVHEIKNY